MSPVEALYARLEHDGPTNAIVEGRIWNERTPRDAQRPCVLFESIAREDVETWDGLSGTVVEQFTVEGYALRLSDRDELRNELRARLCALPSTNEKALGLQGITIDPGSGAPIEIDGLALFGWQDTYTVVTTTS